MLKTQIKTMIVNDYPIRYHAYKNHGTIIENEDAITGNIKSSGQELLYYYNEILYQCNLFHNSNNYGYCVIEIYNNPYGIFVVKLSAEYPDYLRKQNNKHYTFKTYQEARQKALQVIDYAESWLRSEWWKDLPVTYVDQKIWDEHREHMKKVMPDGTKVARLVGDGNKYSFNVDTKKYKHNEYFKVIVI